MSPRRGKSFVAVNCAAIPHELVESELFGVEKGAFTGALVSRPGRFERADGGTLFLDEDRRPAGSAQAKLLRVLQEGEIERLGDQKTRKINVRVVAATNADLQQLVKEGRFRSDLYYRLNALPDRHPAAARAQAGHPAAGQAFPRQAFGHPRQEAARLHRQGQARAAVLPLAGQHPRTAEFRRARRHPRPQRHPHRGQPPVHVLRRRAAARIRPRSTGNVDINCWETGKDLREAVFNGSLTLDQVEAMLLETAVDKARGNLSSAARMLGLTRPQIAYRLKRLHEGKDAGDPAYDGILRRAPACPDGRATAAGRRGRLSRRAPCHDAGHPGRRRSLGRRRVLRLATAPR
jgi:hypothetical protein